MRARSLLLWFLVVAIFAPVAIAAPYAPTRYRLTLLPGPANAISDAGWIVGNEGYARAYRWKDGAWEWLPKMHQAFGVNNLGDVVGSYDGEIWEPNAGQILTREGSRLFYAGTSTSWIWMHAVNDHGIVAGSDHRTRPSPVAWGTGYIPLSPAPIPNYGAGEALAVNNMDWIAGWSGDYWNQFNGTDLPMLWKPDKAVVLRLPPGAKGAHVTALSDTGIVGGVYWLPSADYFNELDARPYLMDLWTGAVTTYSQIEAGDVQGINNAGVAVGEIARTRPAIFGPDGSVWRLQNLVDDATDWQLSRAADIDNLGRVVGTATRGQYPNQQTMGFLLTPVPVRYTPPSGGR